MKKSIKKVHFIGIGGIGVSALAKYYLEKGWEVSGSDLVSSEITDALKKLGAKIFIINSKFKIQNSKLQFKIKNANLIIYSPAIPQNDLQLELAKKLKIKCQSYPQALGGLTKKYFTIAICGTHGKSTTTAMIGLLLVKAGLDPTVIVGTKLKEFSNSNCRVGKSEYLVIEADEHFASFFNYWPKIIVLTSLEPDHLDYFKNFKNYILAFKKFISHLPKDGFLIANQDNKVIYNTFSTLGEKVLFYSLKQKEAEKIKKILKIFGEHNLSNALATLKVARLLKIPDKVSFKALSEYKGSWRRFEEKDVLLKRAVAHFYGKNKRKFKDVIEFKVISDYGHHPTEIKATLQAAREKYPRKKIWLIYQPHQYQRTFYLFKDFIKVFKNLVAEKIIITDIFDVPGREDKKIKKKVSSEKLVKKIKKANVIYLSKKKILNYLKKNLEGKEIVIIMGAGDIYKLSENL